MGLDELTVRGCYKMLTQHCDTGAVVVQCFLSQIKVAKWSQPRARTDHD